MAIRVKSAVRAPVAVQTPAAPTVGSISPPSAVMMLVVGSPPVGSPMIQVPTNGWPAMAVGVASCARVVRPRARALVKAPETTEMRTDRRRMLDLLGFASGGHADRHARVVAITR